MGRRAGRLQRQGRDVRLVLRRCHTGLAATTAPPHLATIAPANTASDYYDGWTYEGGEFRLAFVQPWAIGLATSAAENRNDQAAAAQLKAAGAEPTRWMDFRPFKDLPPMQPQNPAVAPWYFDWIRHSTRDDFWRQFSIRERYQSVKVPVLHFEGWYDGFLAGGTENFAGMVAHGGTELARDNQRLVIGPWDHVNWGRPDSSPVPLLKDIGEVGDSPINDLMLAWFDHFLKGQQSDVAGKPRVDYFVMGANTWKSATSWPLPQTKWTTFYLSGPGGIDDRRGELVSAARGAQPPDTYTYDPQFPAPSLGGHSCCGAQSGPQGPYDQVPVEQRSDVLIYSSARTRARHRGDRTGDCAALGPIDFCRYRFHGQAHGGQARWSGDQPEQRNPADPIPGVIVEPHTDHSGPPIRVSNPHLANQLRIPNRRSHPAGHLQQRLS